MAAACRSTIGPALAGATLYWAALPPLDLGWLAWITPVPWILLIRRQSLAGRRPYVALWLANFLFWLAAIYWLLLPHWATSVGWLALSFYQAFYLPVFVGLSRIAVHRLRISVILAAPIVWTGLELARGHLLTGFTMASLGHTQYRYLHVIQISDLVGAYGVSFVVMFVAACLGRMLSMKAYWPLAPMAAVLAAVLGYGHLRLQTPPESPKVNIALIQGSIDIELKYEPGKEAYIHEHYMDLSWQAVREARERGIVLDLIVWPETMFAVPIIVYDPNARPPEGRTLDDVAEVAEESRRAIAAAARQLSAPLLLGIDARHLKSDRLDAFNSAAHVSRSGEILGRYDKMHLVLFGEYVPLASRFPWLEKFTPLPGSSTAGDTPKAFDVGPLRIAPSICYETVLPHIIRRQIVELARQGREPHVLVNLTNDGWFWGSTELDMHLVCGIFRAVEFRKPLVVAANTGFSAWIEADGTLRWKGPRRDRAVHIAEVGPDSRRSLYELWGDWFAGSCLAASLALAGVGWRLRAGRA